MIGKSKSEHGDAAKYMGFAAIGLAAGLAANFGRKLLVQGPSLIQGNWLEALKAEHKTVLGLLDALEQTDDSQTIKRKHLLAHIKQALGKHAFQEENVIYPALRDHGFAAQAESLIVEHGDVKHFLFELDTMAKDAAEFLPTVRALHESLKQHMHEEEDEIFPPFDAKLDEDQRHKLTVDMNKEGIKLA